MSAIILFEEKHVRRTWNQTEEKWYYAIVDVIAILTGSVAPGAYWRKLKERLKAEGNETVTSCHGLKMTAVDGKQRLTDVADTQQLLRLIQSIPSPKAEHFKLWLSNVGYERLEEIENQELAAKRMREIYQQKGCSEGWIEKRLRGTAVRDELTDEWKKRGVKTQKEFAILTAEISKATFGMFAGVQNTTLGSLPLALSAPCFWNQGAVCGSTADRITFPPQACGARDANLRTESKKWLATTRGRSPRVSILCLLFIHNKSRGWLQKKPHRSGAFFKETLLIRTFPHDGKKPICASNFVLIPLTQ